VDKLAASFVAYVADHWDTVKANPGLFIAVALACLILGWIIRGVHNKERMATWEARAAFADQVKTAAVSELENVKRESAAQRKRIEELAAQVDNLEASGKASQQDLAEVRMRLMELRAANTATTTSVQTAIRNIHSMEHSGTPLPLKQAQPPGP
jgi:hypothetical protein